MLIVQFPCYPVLLSLHVRLLIILQERLASPDTQETVMNVHLVFILGIGAVI